MAKKTSAKKKPAKKKPAKKKPAKKESPPRKRNPSIKNLNNSQRTFIEKKVKELGNLEAVAKFYCLDDAVSYYSMKMAKKFKLPKKKGEKNAKV